jgi:Zn-dependent protease
MAETTTSKLRFRLPEGQTLVWWLIEMQHGLPRQIISFSLFLITFHIIFRWSWSLSIAMLVSMFLHECGHAFVLWLAKIRFAILYLFPLGAVAAPINKEEDARSDLLHWSTVGGLLQSGCAVNVALMLIFTFVPKLMRADSESGALLVRFAKDMVYVNGLLASMNLVPLWTLDAGQLFKVIYNSLDEKEDNWLTGILLGGSGILLLVLIGIPGVISWALVLAHAIIYMGWIVFLVFFAIGVLNKQGRDEPLNAYSKLAMSNKQVVLQIGTYLLLVGLTLWIFAGPLR